MSLFQGITNILIKEGEITMGYYDSKKLTVKEMIKGVKMSEVHLDQVMVTMVTLEPGAVIPEHSHPHEQITYCISGEFEMTVEGETRKLTAGCGFAVPSNAKHSVNVGSVGALVTDSWSPVREDYKFNK
jgi:quercetin dioxygenase-like cupin family protein